MIINSKMLSLPPFISTSWENVRSLHWDRGTDLVITLFDGSKVVIPQLPIPILHQVFKAHSDFLDTHAFAHAREEKREGIEIFKGSLGDLNLGEINLAGMNVIDAPFQHNPEQANFPIMPASLLEKMTSLLKVIGLDQFESMPPAEPHCNCLFCQVSRTVHNLRDDLASENDAIEQTTIQTNDEEIVTDEDLRFKEWDIVQLGEQRYQVSNPLDTAESFQVFLGDPLGCTCGAHHCQHIKAVLKT